MFELFGRLIITVCEKHSAVIASVVDKIYQTEIAKTVFEEQRTFEMEQFTPPTRSIVDLASLFSDSMCFRLLALHSSDTPKPTETDPRLGAARNEFNCVVRQVSKTLVEVGQRSQLHFLRQVDRIIGF